jgi:hypothetical protein
MEKIGQSETRIACAPVWWPCLLMDRDKMCNLYRGPSINASYQVSVHMAEGFQRRVGTIYGRSSIKIAHFVPIR